MKRFSKAALQLSLFSFLLLNSKVFSQPPLITYHPVITGLSAPVDIINAHDGSNRLFIVQQGGLIKVWNGTALSDFMNLSSIISTGGERGLLSMVFHPGFDGTGNRYFFVYYTNSSGDLEISRYQTTSGNSNTGDPTTRTVIITIPHPTNTNHNGGKLNFGPDGYLYIATGDGGGGNDVPNNTQNGNVLLGKMLRLDIDNPGPAAHPNYAIPPDNPYVSDGAVLDEIYNLGLRNPFRWSFDRQTGDLWIGDVGQDSKEEIDFRPAGSTGHNNFGWRCYEGYISTPNVADCTPADNVFPVFDYDNPNPGASAVTGGYVYRGTEFANLQGYYLAADVYSGTLYFLWPNGSGGFDSAFQNGLQNFIVGFGEGEDGSLYAVSQGTNTAYKIVAAAGAPLPVRLKSFTVQQLSNYNELKWATAMEQNTLRFHVEYSTDKVHFSRAGQVAASGNADGSDYSFRHYFSSATLFYRLAMEEADGRINYSSILRVSSNADKALKVYPTIISNRVLTVSLSLPANKLQLINSSGAVVFEKNLNGLSGASVINLPALAKGIYLVQVTGENEMTREKIIIE